MGEYADYMLNGDDCQVCGEHMGEGDGYPRTCAGCGGDDDEPAEKPRKERTDAQRKKLREKRKRKRQNKRNRQAAWQFIGELPKSEQPWQFAAFKGGIVCCNPEHPPMMVIDGKLEVIKMEAPDADRT